MALRVMMDQKKGATLGAGILMIAVAAGVTIYRMAGRADGVTTPAAFFTVDDGTTYFRGEPAMVPPFDHNGKTVVTAKVGQCPDGTRVLYMQRFTPESRRVVQKIRSGDKNVAGPELAALANGREYKKPGDKDWKPIASDNELRAWLMGVACKDKSQPKWLDE